MPQVGFAVIQTKCLFVAITIPGKGSSAILVRGEDKTDMMFEDPKYDVAISFLAADEAIAAELNRQLSETMNVFFFPETAGGDCRHGRDGEYAQTVL